MKKLAVIVVLAGAVGAGGWYYYRSGAAATEAATPAIANAAGRGAARGRAALAVSVDSAVASRHDVTEYITVVGNLIGETTIDIVPRLAGRLESVTVKLGDRVTHGQIVAKMDDRDVREQVSQAEANLEVNKATVRTRESDLKSAELTLQRQKTMLAAGLTSKQNFDDADARYSSALSQLDVAKAQAAQTQARIEELRVTLGNTNIISPVDGFVGRRNLDPGAFAGTNTPVISVVSIGTVRLVANLVEKDFGRIQNGMQANVEVDAFPGEQFTGQVSRVAPVFDAATRTAVMEIEVPNPGYRLKPGMYARVSLLVAHQAGVVTVPRGALVDLQGQRGVFVIDQQTARFHPIRTGLQDAEHVQVLDGVTEGQRVVTTGALAVKDGDRVQFAGAQGPGAPRGGDASNPSRARGAEKN